MGKVLNNGTAKWAGVIVSILIAVVTVTFFISRTHSLAAASQAHCQSLEERFTDQMDVLHRIDVRQTRFDVRQQMIMDKLGVNIPNPHRDPE